MRNVNTFRSFLAGIGATMLIGSPSFATEIGNTSSGGNVFFAGQTDFNGTIFNHIVGQSFKAVDPLLISIGVSIAQLGSQINIPYTIDLYAGEGINGALVASRSFIYTPKFINGTAPFKDIDFSGTALTIGSLYTFFISSNSYALTEVFASYNNAYVDGDLFLGLDQAAYKQIDSDLVFRVTGTNATAVPGPVAGSGLPAILAVGAFVVLMKRRQSSVV